MSLEQTPSSRSQDDHQSEDNPARNAEEQRRQDALGRAHLHDPEQSVITGQDHRSEHVCVIGQVPHLTLPHGADVVGDAVAGTGVGGRRAEHSDHCDGPRFDAVKELHVRPPFICSWT